MAAGRSRLFSAILIDPPSLDRRQTALEIPPSPPWNFCKSSRVRRSRENFIELISPIRWGANGSIRDKEGEARRLSIVELIDTDSAKVSRFSWFRFETIGFQKIVCRLSRVNEAE